MRYRKPDSELVNNVRRQRYGVLLIAVTEHPLPCKAVVPAELATSDDILPKGVVSREGFAQQLNIVCALSGNDTKSTGRASCIFGAACQRQLGGRGVNQVDVHGVFIGIIELAVGPIIIG